MCSAIGLSRLRKFEITYISFTKDYTSPQATIVIEMHPDEWLRAMNKNGGYPAYEVVNWRTKRETKQDKR